LDVMSRVKSGKSGLFTYRWTFASGFVHASSLSLLGCGQVEYGQFTDRQGASLAFRFPASGSLGFMMTIRSRQCLFVFRYRAIITSFLKQLAWSWVESQNWGGYFLGGEAMPGMSGVVCRRSERCREGAGQASAGSPVIRGDRAGTRPAPTGSSGGILLAGHFALDSLLANEQGGLVRARRCGGAELPGSGVRE